MAGNLDTKITITAVDKVTPTLKSISQSFERMKNAARGISASFSAVGSAASDFGARVRNLALVSAAAGGALFALAKKQGAYAEQITMMSQKTGFSTDSLQKWEFAGRLVNLQLDDMVIAMRKLSVNMANVSNPKNDVSKWFKKNGLVDAKGKVLDLETTLSKLADIFQKMPDGAAKMKLATDLFGKAGVRMIPLLNQGSAAIKQIMKEAEKYGITSEENLKIQAEFDDQVDRLNQSFAGLGRTLGGVLIPLFAPLVAGLTEWITQNRELIAQNVASSAREIGSALWSVGSTLVATGRAVYPVIEAFGGLTTLFKVIAFTYIGGLVLSFARLLKALIMVVPALWAFSTAAWAAVAPLVAIAAPIAFVVGAIGLIGFALYKLISEFEQTRAAWNQLWGQVPESVRTAISSIISVLTLGMSELPSIISSAMESIKASFAKGGLSQVFEDMFAGAKEKVSAALSSLLPDFSGFVSSVMGFFQPLIGIFDKIVAGIGRVKDMISGGVSGTVNVQTNMTQGASVGAQPAAAAPAAGLGAKTALNTTPTLTTAANQAPQKQHLDVYMKIDAEGRPKVSAKSDGQLAFSSSTGKMV